MEENNNKIRKYNINLEAINNKLIIMENKAIKMLEDLNNTNLKNIMKMKSELNTVIQKQEHIINQLEKCKIKKRKLLKSIKLHEHKKDELPDLGKI